MTFPKKPAADDVVEELDVSAIVIADDFEAAIPTVVELHQLCPDCEPAEDPA